MDLLDADSADTLAMDDFMDDINEGKQSFFIDQILSGYIALKQHHTTWVGKIKSYTSNTHDYLLSGLELVKKNL